MGGTYLKSMLVFSEGKKNRMNVCVYRSSSFCCILNNGRSSGMGVTGVTGGEYVNVEEPGCGARPSDIGPCVVGKLSVGPSAGRRWDSQLSWAIGGVAGGLVLGGNLCHANSGLGSSRLSLEG